MSQLSRVLSRSLRVLALLGLPVWATSADAQIVFEPPVVHDGGGYATHAALGDLNEDGLLDAVVSHMPFFGDVPSLLPGRGGGTFGPPQPITLGAELQVVERLADFDGDGHLDLLASGGSEPPINVAVLFGDGRGAFGPPLAVNSQHESPVAVDVGDFDVDGALDIAIYNAPGFFFQPGGITVRFGRGDGSFEPAVMVLELFPDVMHAVAPHVLRVGDTNGDGIDDIVFKSTNPVLLSQGDRTFVQAPCEDCVDFAAPPDLVLADFNGDGREDALTPTQVLLAQPDGTFAEPLPLTSEFVPFRVAAGDLDGDGHLDAIVARQDSTEEFNWGPFGDVLLLRGNGDGSFQSPGVVVSHVPQVRELVVADVDLDGRPDVVAADLQPTSQALSVLLNHTYGVGSPFTDVGSALSGSNGYPIQLASGTLVAGQPFSFKLANGPPNGAAFHIVGLAALNAPFKGGTLIPFPLIVNGPLPLNAGGGINLAANWPPGGAGLTLWVQFWMPNSGGPAGFVASSGVRAQVP